MSRSDVAPHVWWVNPTEHLLDMRLSKFRGEASVNNYNIFVHRYNQTKRGKFFLRQRMKNIHTKVLVENPEDSILKPHFSFRLQGSINICFNIYHDFLSYKLFKFPLSHFHFCYSHYTSWQKTNTGQKGYFHSHILPQSIIKWKSRQELETAEVPPSSRAESQ